MENSKIEWTDNTENIIRIKGSRAFYCTKVSPGCKNCYAETMSKRLAGIGHDAVTYEYKVSRNTPELELREDVMRGWAQRKHPKKLFVSSMTDVFGEFVPDIWVYKILDAMIAASLQTFQVLTKRATRMKELVNAYCERKVITHLPDNIWLIVSVEDQHYANERIPELLKTNCSIRGLSIEPLLGPVDLTKISLDTPVPTNINCLTGDEFHFMEFRMRHIDWVITGGESGHGARPMHPDWVREIRDNCREYGTAFFFKQWGEWVPIEESAQPPFFNYQNGTVADGHELLSIEEMENSKRWDPGWWCIEESEEPCLFERVGKKKAGNLLDGVTYEAFPIKKQGQS